MRKWWRKYKNRKGWDFHKKIEGLFFYRTVKAVIPNHMYTHEQTMICDPNGCYSYTCKYCGKYLLFPWKETMLAYHNMQRHIKAKHIDVL